MGEFDTDPDADESDPWPDEGTQAALNDELDCCDDPHLSVSEWVWNTTAGCWQWSGVCYNCWKPSHGRAAAVEVSVDG